MLRFSPAFLGPSAARVAANASIALAVEVLVGALRTIRGVCLANRALRPQLSHDILQFVEHVCHSEQWDYNPGCGECFTYPRALRLWIVESIDDEVHSDRVAVKIDAPKGVDVCLGNLRTINMIQ